MFNRAKNFFYSIFILPLINLWHWLYNKIPFTNRNIDEGPEWPYHDDVIDEEGKQKIVYFLNELGLESRMSRKFRKRIEDEQE